jgi:3-methyladenine DNA glycosylase/8-oxoguanine DNA glycosylase
VLATVRAEVRPRWPLRLPGPGLDGVVRRLPGNYPAIERLLHVDGAPVVVGAAQPSADRVHFAATAERADVAHEGLARLRFAIGVDDDLRPFHDRFARDPLIGPSVRSRPGLRVARNADPFQALAWAVCEQLIEFERAAAIERRILRKFGRTWPEGPRPLLRDAPSAATVAGLAPAQLAALDLSPGRALALIRCAREVASGRACLDPAADVATQEHAWARLRTIRGIGAWTVEVLALHGQGRHDQLPAVDLAYLDLVGRLQTGNPRARAEEHEVRAFFAPYAPWAGLAAAHAMRVTAVISPARAGTRSSETSRAQAA